MSTTPTTMGRPTASSLANLSRLSGLSATSTSTHGMPIAQLEEDEHSLISNYFHEFEWDIAIPTPTSSPLLYHPNIVTNAFRFPRNVMQTDVDAMQLGLLDEIRLNYFLIHPSDAREAALYVAEREEAMKDKTENLAKKGLMPSVIDDPFERNPLLLKDDWELVDIDFDESPLTNRSLPTLALLKRPIYTELGTISREARAEQRLNKLREQQRVLEEGTGGSSQDGGNMSPSTPNVNIMASPSNARGHYRSREEWIVQSNLGFKKAKGIDASFQNFLRKIQVEKLGLINDSERNIYVTKNLLFRLSHFGKRFGAQDLCWRVACQFARNYGNPQDQSTTIERARKLLKDENDKLVPEDQLSATEQDTWYEWFALLTQAVQEDVPYDRRNAAVKHTPTETVRSRDTRGEEKLKNELKRTKDGLKIIRWYIQFRDGTTTANYASLKELKRIEHPATKRQFVFPLAVRPVYPAMPVVPSARPDATQTLNPDEEPDPMHFETNFGNSGEKLVNAIFRGAAPQQPFSEGTTTATVAPHVVVGGKQLLHPISMADGPAVSAATEYHPDPIEFTPTLVSQHSRSSYLLNFQEDCVEYDRIGTVVEFEHGTSTSKNELKGTNFLYLWNTTLPPLSKQEKKRQEEDRSVAETPTHVEHPHATSPSDRHSEVNVHAMTTLEEHPSSSEKKKDEEGRRPGSGAPHEEVQPTITEGKGEVDVEDLLDALGDDDDEQKEHDPVVGEKPEEEPADNKGEKAGMPSPILGEKRSRPASIEREEGQEEEPEKKRHRSEE